MNIIRQHPYLISLAALLVILPVPVLAVGEDLVFPLVTTVFGLFVRLAAMLLNFSINHFVIDFGGVYANTGVGYAVDTTWIIIRDFVNMGFIFGFVYIGFKMILNSNDSNTRRWLVNILLAALLVNFSLFITKFVVDFSNQIAAQIVVNGLGGEYTTNTRTGLAEVDLGQSFLDRMGITSIWENAPQGDIGWGYIFGSALLFMITTFVFAAGGILLIIRFAILNLFLVLSPLMFLSWILPGLRDTMNRYWSGFLGRAFFAPVYLLFIYFSLQIISGLQVAVSGPGSNLANPSWAGTFQAVGNAGARNVQESTLGTLPFFVLICVFMIASLVIAQKMGADGGDRAVALGKTFSNKVRRTAVRQTAGRGLRVAGAAAASAETSLNRRLGTMAQGGAASRATARFLDRTAGAGLRSTQNASAAGSESYSARNTRVESQNARLNQQDSNRRREEEREAAEAAAAAAQAELSTVNNNPNATEDEKKAAAEAKKAAEARMAAAIKQMTNDEILDMARSSEGSQKLNSEDYSKHLSDAQIKALQDSGVYTNDQTKKLKESRENATFKNTESVLDDVNASADDLNTAFEDLGKTIKNLSEERLQNTKVDRLTDKRFASHLSDSQIESLQKSGKFTSQQLQQIKDARTAGITGRIDGSILGNNPNANSETFKNKQRERILSGSAQDIGKLPIDVFTNIEMASRLTPAMIEQRMKNGGVTAEQLSQIKTNISGHIAGQQLAGKSVAMWDNWKNTVYGAQFFEA